VQCFDARGLLIAKLEVEVIYSKIYSGVPETKQTLRGPAITASLDSLPRHVECTHREAESKTAFQIRMQSNGLKSLGSSKIIQCAEAEAKNSPHGRTVAQNSGLTPDKGTVPSRVTEPRGIKACVTTKGPASSRSHPEHKLPLISRAASTN